jgi:hypothetical protein
MVEENWKMYTAVLQYRIQYGTKKTEWLRNASSTTVVLGYNG